MKTRFQNDSIFVLFFSSPNRKRRPKNESSFLLPRPAPGSRSGRRTWKFPLPLPAALPHLQFLANQASIVVVSAFVSHQTLSQTFLISCLQLRKEKHSVWTCKVFGVSIGNLCTSPTLFACIIFTRDCDVI